mmetsp:Transcript_18860/g.55306  ORF Transcript_18860/g.55306 Transcript_18860/m.55306 type:complete len:442 (+) Transcript_18860:3187-4512(+)
MSDARWVLHDHGAVVHVGRGEVQQDADPVDRVNGRAHVGEPGELPREVQEGEGHGHHEGVPGHGGNEAAVHARDEGGVVAHHVPGLARGKVHVAPALLAAHEGCAEALVWLHLGSRLEDADAGDAQVVAALPEHLHDGHPRRVVRKGRVLAVRGGAVLATLGVVLARGDGPDAHLELGLAPRAHLRRRRLRGEGDGVGREAQEHVRVCSRLRLEAARVDALVDEVGERHVGGPRVEGREERLRVNFCVLCRILDEGPRRAPHAVETAGVLLGELEAQRRPRRAPRSGALVTIAGAHQETAAVLRGAAALLRLCLLARGDDPRGDADEEVGAGKGLGRLALAGLGQRLRVFGDVVVVVARVGALAARELLHGCRRLTKCSDHVSDLWPTHLAEVRLHGTHVAQADAPLVLAVKDTEQAGDDPRRLGDDLLNLLGAHVGDAHF